MKRRIIALAGHPLVSGSAIIFSGSLIANVFNFLFNLAMTRYLLTPSEYGILASLTSLFILASQPVGAIVPTLIYFSASYFAKGELDKVRGLFFKVTKPAILGGTMVFLLSVFFANSVAQFLHITERSLIILVGFMIYMGFIGIANFPFLQAKLAFTFIAFSSTVGALSKLILGILFVWLGYSVGGALWAFFMGFLIPYLISFVPLRFLLNKGITTPHIDFKTLLGYGAPAALASFGLNGLINTDIILVKHFFDPDLAGLYATLSLIGKVIFFFSAPIGTVMFPLITQRHERRENFHRIFWLSLILVFLSSAAIIVFYFIFPEFTIRIFAKDTSAMALIPYLGTFSIFIMVYSLLTIMINFYLSINKTKIFIPILIASFLQGIFIWFYHANFLQVIYISLGITGLLLLLLLLYYWKLYGSKEKIKIK